MDEAGINPRIGILSVFIYIYIFIETERIKQDCPFRTLAEPYLKID